MFIWTPNKLLLRQISYFFVRMIIVKSGTKFYFHVLIYRYVFYVLDTLRKAGLYIKLGVQVLLLS